MVSSLKVASRNPATPFAGRASARYAHQQSNSTGADTEYIYRVPHPFCAVLYKTGSRQRERHDVIALLGQPVEEDWVLVHIVICLLDEIRDLATLRRFHQTIFRQDKPILENQVPKRLPLDTRTEVPIRADAASAAYRR